MSNPRSELSWLTDMIPPPGPEVRQRVQARLAMLVEADQSRGAALRFETSPRRWTGQWSHRLAVVFVAAAIIVVFFVPVPHVSLFHRLVTPAKVTAPTKLPAVDLSATPKGWVPVAYGDAQVSVPATWDVLFNVCVFGSSVGDVYVNPSGGFCTAQKPPKGRTTVTLLPETDGEFHGSPSSYGQLSVINGIAVYALYNYGHGPYVGTDYLVPSLGVEVAAEGPLARRVVATLTRSPRTAALATGPAPSVPASWHQVTFAGLRFSVPGDWAVTRTSTWNGCGPVQVALPQSVTLDTDKTFQAMSCAPSGAFPVTPSNGVRVDAGAQGPTGSSSPTGSFSPAGSCLNLGGLKVRPSRTPDYSILFLKVTVPGRSKPVYVSIGLAGNGMVARTILYSLRPASPSDACPAAGIFAPGELFGVQFLSVTTGWTVGSNGILATRDGGLRWTVQYRARCADLSEIDFVDAEHGWAVGLRDLLVTTDGGRHWLQLHEPTWPIRSVHFVSQTVGYAVAGGGVSGDRSPMAPWTGGVVLKTLDGGQSWRLLAAPADAQSVCFSTTEEGLLGADGRIYRSLDGGRSWSLVVKGDGPGEDRPLATVQCVGQRAGWAELDGPGGEMSQSPHIAFHSDGGAWTPIFAEQYFPHPGIDVSVNSPGSYSGPFSAIDPDTAVFIDNCAACAPAGTAPWAIAERGGKELVRRGNVGHITSSLGASFVTSRSGWVTGIYWDGSSTVYRLVHTNDAGRTWTVEYTS